MRARDIMKINLTGFMKDNTGYGSAARRTLLALEAVGADVRPGVCLSDGSDPMDGDGPLDAFLASEPHARPDVHLMLTAADQVVTYGLLHAFPAGKRAVYTCWETDSLHPSFQSACEAADLVLVPSAHSAEAVRKAGIRAEVVPFCVVEPLVFLPSAQEWGHQHGIPDETIVFYTVMTWQDRKNPLGLLTAYLTAFSGYDPVRLVLKVFAGQSMRASIERQIQAIQKMLNLPNLPGIYLITGEFTDQQMWALHTRGDCFVSLARGEAFGIPILDAFSTGNRIVATDWGGHVDFLSPDHPLTAFGVKMVPYRMTPVLQAYHYFTGHQNWADPDILAAREALQEQLAQLKVTREKLQRRLPSLSPAAVGQRLLEVLRGH